MLRGCFQSRGRRMISPTYNMAAAVPRVFHAFTEPPPTAALAYSAMASIEGGDALKRVVLPGILYFTSLSDGVKSWR